MEYKYTTQDLKTMQSWSLERKIQVTQTRIIEWYQRFNGQIYVSFSGGKDSTVLLDLARRIYPDVEVVFVDTGLEFPEIRSFVKLFDGVTRITPEKPFYKIIEEYGYPVISKEVSKIVYGVFNGRTERTRQNYRNKLNGLNPDGTVSPYKMQRYPKWSFLLDAPFKISNRCCYWIKEKPCIKFERESGKKPIIATMASDSHQRADGWRKTGCNAFDGNRAISKPMSFWTEQDILKYIKLTELPYCDVYGEIIEEMTNYKRKTNKPTGKLKTTGEERTGCMFCMYGCHLHKINRFQRMKITHPKQYDYCINKLGCGEVLDYIDVKYI